MLTGKELREKLPLDLDEKTKERFDVAYRSIGYQNQYCRYHYEKFKEELALFKLARSGEAQEFNAQYYRIAFEANAFAFFKSLHSLIDSVPYFLNIILSIKGNIEDRNINWNTIKNNVDDKIVDELKELDSYKELEHLVNISKHRRVPRVDSGFFKNNEKPRFWGPDLDMKFRFYEIETLMEALYDELLVKTLNLITTITADI